MVGIVSGGLIGGPVGTILIERHRLRRRRGAVRHDPPIAAQIVENQMRAHRRPRAGRRSG
jgi:Na+/glutamate symporter